MKVVAVKVNKEAEIIDVDEISLEWSQKFVGGYIEAFYGFDDCVIICNDEGKLTESLNRAIYNENGEIVDIIAGDFFVCGIGNDFIGLDDETAEKYRAMFDKPEMFFMKDGRIVAIKA